MIYVGHTERYSDNRGKLDSFYNCGRSPSSSLLFFNAFLPKTTVIQNPNVRKYAVSHRRRRSLIKNAKCPHFFSPPSLLSISQEFFVSSSTTGIFPVSFRLAARLRGFFLLARRLINVFSACFEKEKKTIPPKTLYVLPLWGAGEVRKKRKRTNKRAEKRTDVISSCSIAYRVAVEVYRRGGRGTRRRNTTVSAVSRTHALGFSVRSPLLRIGRPISLRDPIN